MHNHQIIALANQKGGVGKTTTAINLSTAMAAIDKKVLLIDLDPQGNASTGLGIENSKRKKNIYDLLILNTKLEEVIQKTQIPNLDIIPSTIDLSGAEISLINQENRETKLLNSIKEASSKYDFIFIDSPPSLSTLTVNALAAATSVLIPLQCEFFALEGLSNLLQTIKLIQKRINPFLKIEGILLTMYDRRYNLTVQVEQDVRKNLGDMVFQTVIPRNVKTAEAPSHGKPALLYDIKCSGSVAYIELAKEILRKKND